MSQVKNFSLWSLILLIWPYFESIPSQFSCWVFGLWSDGQCPSLTHSHTKVQSCCVRCCPAPCWTSGQQVVRERYPRFWCYSASAEMFPAGNFFLIRSNPERLLRVSPRLTFKAISQKLPGNHGNKDVSLGIVKSFHAHHKNLHPYVTSH